MSNKSQSFIEKVIVLKKEDLKKQKKDVSFEELQYAVSQLKIKKSKLYFREQFTNKNKISLIAEIKFASPTHPNLGSHQDLLSRAKQYEKAGAEALSLITEKHYFKGDGRFISRVKEQVLLPVLQKDFVIDAYQLYEAKLFGSDAILLIARLVDEEKLNEFVDLCFSLGIEPVVEINNNDDLQKANKTKAKIIAVNARDLETLNVDMSKAYLLLNTISDNFIKLGFSGIHSAKDVLNYKNAGANGVLIGTSLMQTENVDEFIKSLNL